MNPLKRVAFQRGSALERSQQAAHQLQRAVQGLGVACGLSLQLGGCPAKQALAAGGGGLPGILSIQPAYWQVFALAMAFAIIVPMALTTVVFQR